jgi:hypothetical protein
MSGIASGGSYYSAGSSNAMWHTFTSDAVTYQALTVNGAVTPYATLRGQAAEVSVDSVTRRLPRGNGAARLRGRVALAAAAPGLAGEVGSNRAVGRVIAIQWHPWS